MPVLSVNKSNELFIRANAIIPGAVNSPVRAWKAVGGSPLFVERAQGARIYDADGNSFIDYVGSYGPAILGHADSRVTAAVSHQLERGFSFGAPTALEVDLAARISRAIPAAEKVRLVNSGTEAAMTAIRIARAATGRPGVVKFDGCYHGHTDSLLVRAGSGAMTLVCLIVPVFRRRSQPRPELHSTARSKPQKGISAQNQLELPR
jgi:glutamate-1-semialdehyde 2,1-aminomutase